MLEVTKIGCEWLENPSCHLSLDHDDNTNIHMEHLTCTNRIFLLVCRVRKRVVGANT